MRRLSSGPPLYTVVLKVGEYYYVLRITQRGTMMRLLGECDNGKGGKSSFIGTTTIAVKNQNDLDYLQKYILEATKLWGRYKPKEFNSFDEAVTYLKEKKNIRPTEVSLYSPKR